MSQLVLFNHLGELNNLKNAVSNLQRLIPLIKDNSADKGFFLFRLGTALVHRFKLLGETDSISNIYRISGLLCLYVLPNGMDMQR
jgi:hypothetical protein